MERLRRREEALREDKKQLRDLEKQLHDERRLLLEKALSARGAPAFHPLFFHRFLDPCFAAVAQVGATG